MDILKIPIGLMYSYLVVYQRNGHSQWFIIHTSSFLGRCQVQRTGRATCWLRSLQPVVAQQAQHQMSVYKTDSHTTLIETTVKLGSQTCQISNSSYSWVSKSFTTGRPTTKTYLGNACTGKPL
jgi:hypothetical protein